MIFKKNRKHQPCELGRRLWNQSPVLLKAGEGLWTPLNPTRPGAHLWLAGNTVSIVWSPHSGKTVSKQTVRRRGHLKWEPENVSGHSKCVSLPCYLEDLFYPRISSLLGLLAKIKCSMGRQAPLSIAGDQPRLIQGIRRRDGVGEDQETTA